MDFRFFILRWVRHELSAELKAKRVKIFKEMLKFLEELYLRQKDHIIMDEECQIY
jgi:hypothetical protein